jgi:hypothetical protein
MVTHHVLEMSNQGVFIDSAVVTITSMFGGMNDFCKRHFGAPSR